MTTCTPIYGLEYQTGSDRPCDAPAVWCAFADSVEAQLNTLDALVDRTIDTVPMVRVRKTTTTPITFAVATNYSASVQFDTVDVDTANMVDLIANPFLITLPRAGIYHASFIFTTSSALTANDNITVFTSTGNAADTYISDGAVSVKMASSSTIAYDPVNATGRDTALPLVTLNITSALSAQTVTFTGAELNLTWIRDLP